jgi:hypothetical protein
VLRHQSLDLQLARERDGIDFTGRHAFEQSLDSDVVRRIAIDIGRNRADHGLSLAQESHEREVGVVAVQLHGDAAAFERLGRQRTDHAVGGRLGRLDARLESEHTQGAGGFRAARDGAQVSEPVDETRAQRRLVFVDAAQDAREPFAGDEHEVIETALGEFHGERQNLRAVRGIVDGDQRAAEDLRAAAFE